MNKITEKIFTIKWHYNMNNIFTYGCKIVKTQNGVKYSNALMPLGKYMIIWKSKTSFINDGHAPNLPLLKPNKNYHFEFNFKSFPEKTAYVKINFFNIQNEVILSECFFSSFDIKIPNYYYYTIELVNGGFEKVEFENIKIYEN